MCERSALLPIIIKAIVSLRTMQIAFFKSHLICLAHLYSSIVNHLWLKLHSPGILLQNQRAHHFSSMWHVQEHYNSWTQQLINLVSAHTVTCAWPGVFLHNSLYFFFFCKVKTKEHYNLHIATLKFEFSPTWKLQRLTIKYKDFSRLCEPCFPHQTKQMK